jgi:hypothetical protein
MQLAYGKFDPDLNPPPFSEWSKSFGAVEIDLFQTFSWAPKVSSYFRSWVRRKGLQLIPRIGLRTERSRASYQEAVDIWNDQFRDETLYFAVHSGRKSWVPEFALNPILQLPVQERYFFEWGKEDTLKGTDFISSLDFSSRSLGGWVVDPHWHNLSFMKTCPFKVHFKLHGWSDERWIRRYGVPQSKKILRLMQTIQNQVLTLSYSGKVIEAPLFMKGIEK